MTSTTIKFTPSRLHFLHRTFLFVLLLLLLLLSLSPVHPLKYHINIHSSAASIGRDSWNSVLRPADATFSKYDFVHLLEDAGCAVSGTGWTAVHLSVEEFNTSSFVSSSPIDPINSPPRFDPPNPIAIVPCYVKAHSFGEFIFDNSWADAAESNGIQYYPKLLSAIPFTPAMSRKVMIRPGVSAQEESAIRKDVAEYLKLIAKNTNLSSVHMNFASDEEIEDLVAPHTPRNLLQQTFKPPPDAYCRRSSLQWHFTNKASCGNKFTDFDDYLSSFRSKRRISIKRERRIVREEGKIRIDAIEGERIRDVPGIAETVYQLYRTTVDKMAPWGRLYLNEEFFERLIKSDLVDSIVLVVARSADCGDEVKAADEIIAGTFNIVDKIAGVFYGRYWGTFEDIKYLHFNVCYYSAIEYCIKTGLHRMEPGAGGGEYKFLRGFDPEIINSAHYVAHPGLRNAIVNFVEEERQGISDEREELLPRNL